MWDKALPAISGLLGVLVGAAALLLSGWVEAQKQASVRRTDALVEFAQAAVLPENVQLNDDQFAEKKSFLTVFASAQVVAAYADYQTCRANDGGTQCPEAWAAVINEMRVAVGQEKAAVEDLITVYFGVRPER